MKCVGHVACIGEKRKAYNSLDRKPEGRDHLGERRRWEDNIKMCLK
jgi:hypothetical protein